MPAPTPCTGPRACHRGSESGRRPDVRRCTPGRSRGLLNWRRSPLACKSVQRWSQTRTSPRSLQLLQLLAAGGGCQRQKLSIPHHLALAFLAEDVAEELLELRIDRRSGLTIEIEIFFRIKRIGAVLHRLNRHLNEGTTLFFGHRELFDLGLRRVSAVAVGDGVFVFTEIFEEGCGRDFLLAGGCLVVRVLLEGFVPLVTPLENPSLDVQLLMIFERPAVHVYRFVLPL